MKNCSHYKLLYINTLCSCRKTKRKPKSNQTLTKSKPKHNQTLTFTRARDGYSYMDVDGYIKSNISYGCRIKT